MTFSPLVFSCHPIQSTKYIFLYMCMLYNFLSFGSFKQNLGESVFFVDLFFRNGLDANIDCIEFDFLIEVRPVFLGLWLNSVIDTPLRGSSKEQSMTILLTL